MPLKAGSSSRVRSTNIGEMLRSFKQTGRIGNSKPGSMKKATAQASAIASPDAVTRKLSRRFSACCPGVAQRQLFGS